jgi:hypothetical protein
MAEIPEKGSLMRRFYLLMTVSVFLGSRAWAGDASGVEALSWMAGTWKQTEGGVTTREAWLAPIDGAMSGMTQTTRPGKPAMFEMKGVIYTAYIQGQPPTAFLLKSGPMGLAMFENPKHDFPQRVIYQQCGRDLCARIEGTMNGIPASKSWKYARVRP